MRAALVIVAMLSVPTIVAASPPFGLPSRLNGNMVNSGGTLPMSFVWSDDELAWKSGRGPSYLYIHPTAADVVQSYAAGDVASLESPVPVNIVGGQVDFEAGGHYLVTGSEWLGYDVSRWLLCLGTGFGIGVTVDVSLSLIASVWSRPLKHAFRQGFSL